MFKSKFVFSGIMIVLLFPVQLLAEPKDDAEWKSYWTVLHDGDSSSALRVKAGEALLDSVPPEGFNESGADGALLRKLVEDQKLSTEIRIAALNLHYFYPSADSHTVLTGLVSNSEESAELRGTAFQKLRTVAEFELKYSGDERARIHAMLQERIDPKYRGKDPLYAPIVKYLATQDDEKAVGILGGVIEGSPGLPIDKGEAILCLQSEDPAKYFKYVRPALVADEASVRGLAIEYLASDERSRQTIQAYFASSDQPFLVRQRAANALSRYDATFPELVSEQISRLPKEPSKEQVDLTKYLLQCAVNAAEHGAYSKTADAKSAKDLLLELKTKLPQDGKNLPFDKQIQESIERIQKQEGKPRTQGGLN